jgi:hypothetical protein
MLEFNSTNNEDCGCDSGPLNGFTDPSCPAPSVVTWNSIQGKPSCFTPCAHTHVPGDIIGLEAYIQSIEYVGNSTTTNSIQLTTPSGVLNANLRLSANAGTGYKVPLSILSDGLIAQIPFASGSNAGVLSAADWITFNNKFSTPSGTIFQYVRGDGSLATFPTFGTLSSVGVTMPAAFGVANSPLTSNGTIAITALGTTAQYIRGDGTLATFPTSVTSVGLSMPAAFAVASSPITSSGILAVTATGTISQYIRGDGTLATFPASPLFLIGSVPFGNGTGLTEDNTKFYWDNTFKTLVIGTNSYFNSGEQLHVYNPLTPKIKLQGTQSSRISLNSTLLTTRNVDLFVSTVGAYLQTSNNIPLIIASNTSSIEFNNDGVSTTSGGIATITTYVNVNSLTVNIARTDNCVFINIDPILGISSATPLTIIMPQTPFGGQEITIVIMSATGLISLGSGEILVQGFGGASNVIGHFPNTTGGNTNGTSGMKYRYFTNIAKWYRIY